MIEKSLEGTPLHYWINESNSDKCIVFLHPAFADHTCFDEQAKMMLKAVFSVKWFAEDNKNISAYTKEAQDKFYEMNLRFKKSSFRYLASLGSLINKVKTAPRDCELLIGVGEHDNEMALKASKQWHEDEKESRFVIFKGAGHIVNMDTPEAFNRELEKML